MLMTDQFMERNRKSLVNLLKVTVCFFLAMTIIGCDTSKKTEKIDFDGESKPIEAAANDNNGIREEAAVVEQEKSLMDKAVTFFTQKGYEVMSEPGVLNYQDSRLRFLTEYKYLKRALDPERMDMVTFERHIGNNKKSVILGFDVYTLKTIGDADDFFEALAKRSETDDKGPTFFQNNNLIIAFEGDAYSKAEAYKDWRVFIKETFKKEECRFQYDFQNPWN